MVQRLSVDNITQAPEYKAFRDPQSCAEPDRIRGESWALAVDGNTSYQQAGLCSAFTTGYGLGSGPVIHRAPEPNLGARDDSPT